MKRIVDDIISLDLMLTLLERRKNNTTFRAYGYLEMLAGLSNLVEIISTVKGTFTVLIVNGWTVHSGRNK